MLAYYTIAEALTDIRDSCRSCRCRQSSHVPPSKAKVCATHLLPQTHDLEALEVIELPPPDGLLASLSVVAALPLLLDLLRIPLLLERGGTGASGKLLDDETGEGEVGKRLGVARDNVLLLGRGTLDKDLFTLLSTFRPHISFPTLCALRSSHSFLPVLTYALVVDDLDDGGELAGEGTAAEHGNTANLDQAPGAGNNFGVTHCVGFRGSGIELLE